MKRFVIVLSLLMLSAVNSFAEEAAAPVAPAMDPEMAAKMAEMQKYGTPGENHKRLELMVGQWNHTGTWQMSEDAVPQAMKGTSENKWIMDGRFLQQEAKGEATPEMPQGFEGFGLTGYDNVKGEYQTVWIDNMGTGMMRGTGQLDEATGTIQESGSFSCPMTGEKDRQYRSVWTIVDNDHYTYEFFTNDVKTGKEFKSMVITYERVK